MEQGRSWIGDGLVVQRAVRVDLWLYPFGPVGRS